ncbi:Crp/Fnr family transcriptional regulator [Desertivirga brevis]|uniref:Crp/Fnr family transcriptional regulator n=1 Tax=Desertivirga brevis TaxID=2810310 RepID=UPI001A974962|nr:Crp/Fnr family transcriptional regulator [Pedobacter sp. SYSU D00873]
MLKFHEDIFEPFFDYIVNKSNLPISEEDKKLIRNTFKIKHLRKRQYLLQEGDVCKYMAFIVKGAGKMYMVNKSGQENVIRLAIESWWLGDFESYTLNSPSVYNIEMIEDSDVLLINDQSMQELIAKVPPLAKMIKEIDRNSAIATQRRIQTAISLGAEERYDEMLQSYPEFIRRFPQTMIASYLGISAETLSRIRKNLLRK